MEPAFDPDNNSENMQNLVERFANAGWLVGTQIVTPSNFRFRFSPKGKARIGAVADALREAWPEFFATKGENLPLRTRLEQLNQFIKFGPVLLEIGKIYMELSPPEFTPGQRDSLIGLLAYAAMHGLPGEDGKWKAPERG